MADARLTHPVRGTLEFRQRQESEDPRQSVTDTAPEVGTDRKPLVHVRTRERQRTVRGTVTGQRRAANDADTDDWEQALANYVAQLEAHMDEFQGTGYTYEEDLRNLSLSAVLTNLEWTYQPQAPYQIEFALQVDIGRGVFEERPIDLETPTVDNSMDVLATVGGFDLPGVREMRHERGVGFETNAVYAKGDAENNDIVIIEGVTHRVTIQGTHSGTDAERRTADANLGGLEGGGQVTLETRFPGYSMDGYVTNYTTTGEARRGGNQHRYALTFLEGIPS